MWMCMPSISIPEQATETALGAPDPIYDRVLQAYGRGASSESSRIFRDRVVTCDSEAMAAAAIAALPHDLFHACSLHKLLDCRSTTVGPGPAPTYRLAARVGLRFAVPLCLSGQKGTEVPQALSLLDADAQQVESAAVVSAVQVIHHPDSREYEGAFPLGDAAAAIITAQRPIPGFRGFDIVAVGLAQGTDDQKATLAAAIGRAIESASMVTDQISWVVAHHYSPCLYASLDAVMPGSVKLSRREHPGINFGCADTLISLAMINDSSEQLSRGTGLLVFAGRHGCVGALLVQSSSPEEQ
jgi:hypothetical protein